MTNLKAYNTKQKQQKRTNRKFKETNKQKQKKQPTMSIPNI